MKPIVCGVLLFVTSGCVGGGGDPVQQSRDHILTLQDALCFYAGFDRGVDAEFARGDGRIRTAPSYAKQAEARPGIGNPDVMVVRGAGVSGDALRFRKKNSQAIFFAAEGNVPTDGQSLTGTVSFWLNLDPERDLEPGYCDPIQLTDTAYNDNAVWVDFTKEAPRQFRLGVFGELDSWNPEKLSPDANPAFAERLVAVEQPPFQSGTWTHVTVVYDGLGTANGSSTLYLDGRLQGSSTGIAEAFAWDMERAAIRLGLSYVGLFDQLTVFDRALTADEVRTLDRLGGEISKLLPNS